MNIQEDYVSFETAKLLKEKGFNPLRCGIYYSTTTGKRTTELFTSLLACPTLQMAMKWLRLQHHLHVLPDITDITQVNPKYYCVIWDTIKHKSYVIELFDSYEQACEEGIKYCLEKLI